MIYKTDKQMMMIAHSQLVRHLVWQWCEIKKNPAMLFQDGFYEPIDPNLCSPFLIELAERSGLKLVDGMWVDL